MMDVGCPDRAEEIAAIQTKRDKGQFKSKVVQCKEVLEGLRGRGWMKGIIIKEMVEASDRTWDRARREMGVETRRVKGPNGQVKDWEWFVPERKPTTSVI